MKTKKQYTVLCKIICVISCYAIAFFITDPTLSKWNNQQVITTTNHETEQPAFSTTYIAPEFPHEKNHVSSITPLDENRIMCVWYAGSKEGAPDVSIYAAIREKNKWSSPQRLVDLNISSKELNRYVRKVGNAVVFKDAEDTLWLFYCSVSLGGWAMARTNYRYSRDNGKTWSRSKELFLNPFLSLSNNVKNKPLVFKNGSFLLPLYQEFINKYGIALWGKWEDNELKYIVKRIGNHQRTLQPTLVRSEDAGLIAFFRNRDKGSMLQSKSINSGINWSPVKKANLPNPNSGFDMLHIREKEFIGVINYSPTERDNLVLVYTNNSGKKWHILHYLETAIPVEQDERFKLIGKKSHYYQYPSIIKHNGNYHLSYTCFEKIKHTTFNEVWLREKIKKVNK
ncbi:exo-alpha-sialidase [Candidatus Uabimicrobium sp. HlEnr_7]|uniref:exo-alpha-sialidase n=1 Tax=Candidatus Uabimicrobium helgolandensis TaxID=3095367 RepID=UPI003558987A